MDAPTLPEGPEGKDGLGKGFRHSRRHRDHWYNGWGIMTGLKMRKTTGAPTTARRQRATARRALLYDTERRTKPPQDSQTNER